VKTGVWFVPFVALALAGCAGGGGGGSVAVAPTPTPAPAPTPTPGTLNDLAAITGSLFFNTFGALSTTSGANTTINGVSTSTLVQTANSASVSLIYQGPSQTYPVSGTPLGSLDPVTQNFGPADLQNGIYSRSGVGSLTVSNSLTTPGGAATIYNYTGWGEWNITSTNAGAQTSNRFEFAYGIPTLLSDLPRTGTATYPLQLTGYDQAGGFPITGGGTLSANFAAGTINVSLSPALVQQPGQTNFTPITTLTGSGAIASNSGAFSAPLTATGYTGGVNGGFYGPQAAEVGGAFYYSGGSAGSSAAGVLLGKKQ
jgi:hypothetical protein